MKHLYKPRHLTNVQSSRRLPIVAASAVLVAAASIAGMALHQSSTPVRTADAQTLTNVDPSRADNAQAARSQQRTQTRPEAETTSPKAGSSSPSARPAGTTAAPASPTSPSTAAAPASKELSYQFKWQENYYFCGPAATRIALTARALFPSQSEVAQSLRTTVNGTNSADDTTRALNAYTKSSFYKSHFVSGQAANQADIDRLRADVINAITNGYAVVANIAGSTVDKDGDSHSYPGGHFLTVVGYSDGGQTVRIADPADAHGVGSYMLSTVNLANWVALRGYSA